MQGGLLLLGLAALGFLALRKGGFGNGTQEAPSQTASPTATNQGGTVSQTQVNAAAWVTPEAGQVYDPAFIAASALYSLPQGLLARIAQQESSFDPSQVSPAGAQGLMQFEPATAAQYGIDPFDAYQSIDAAGQMMQHLYLRFGNWRAALAAYNWGEGHVARFGFPSPSAPAETVLYVQKIAGDLGL